MYEVYLFNDNLHMHCQFKCTEPIGLVTDLLAYLSVCDIVESSVIINVELSLHIGDMS